MLVDATVLFALSLILRQEAMRALNNEETAIGGCLILCGLGTFAQGAVQLWTAIGW